MVGDAGNIPAWFPMVKNSEATAGGGSCVLHGDVPLDEERVTNGGELRRFQYRVTGRGAPVTLHSGTVDVLDQDGSSTVVSSSEVTPDEVADTLGPAIEDGLRELTTYCGSQR